MEAPATGELVIGILQALGLSLTAQIALPLFVSIATDTGWFRFQNTGVRAMEAATELVAAGVSPGEVYQRVYELYSPERMALNMRYTPIARIIPEAMATKRGVAPRSLGKGSIIIIARANIIY